MVPEPIAVTLQVIGVLDDLGIRYVIGGSLASSVHGVARATRDADLVVELQQHQVLDFVSALQDEFYVDEHMINQAIGSQSSFNLIHLKTMFKVDCFIPKTRQFDQAQLDNRIAHTLVEESELTAFVLSAEDTILAKLDWYRMGGEQSERQWRDVSGIWQVQGESLNQSYLTQQAQELGVVDLLNRLR